MKGTIENWWHVRRGATLAIAAAGAALFLGLAYLLVGGGANGPGQEVAGNVAAPETDPKAATNIAPSGRRARGAGDSNGRRGRDSLSESDHPDPETRDESSTASDSEATTLPTPTGPTPEELARGNPATVQMTPSDDTRNDPGDPDIGITKDPGDSDIGASSEKE